MESFDLARLIAKLAVSAIALSALGFNLFSSSTKLDSSDLVLVFFALLPWLASVISRAELPGGWKVVFQEVKGEQQRQAREIEALKFLLSNFLTEAEIAHLKGLDSMNPYWARQDRTTNFFEGELRRLRALGFIQGLPDRGVRSLLAAMRIDPGAQVNVKDHFEITARGRDYLRLRAEM